MTEGLRHLEAGIAARVSHGSYRADPELARARAVAGACALASGDRKSAERLAQAAREAFVEQPDVSPYFKRPSETLDRRPGRFGNVKPKGAVVDSPRSH
ncbi:hypothetical protein [Piscinibacter sp. XHJ-5]|uniref:hypothetical protein n=1 Tax=Piscinibacter sp. XHJ-5 TaxID=3037797 RepID=UPI0024531B68|nr:hypothetical protein [Piscinibacter sp. XHJ-5]